MSWPPYPEYTPSGVEWLGEIPVGWTTSPVKRRYAVRLGKMLQNNPESDGDVSVPYIKALHVLWGKVETSDLPEMWASPSEIQRFGVKSGDLLVCEGGEAGRAGIADSLPDPCIIQNALHRVRGRGADTRFLQFVLQAVGSRGWFDVLCNKATIAHFTGEKLAELRIPIPPSQEDQRAIAAFLDRETGRIDALIEKKQRQIELLQEKRAALITHAVTKGINGLGGPLSGRNLSSSVIPAKPVPDTDPGAGIQNSGKDTEGQAWAPASAGATGARGMKDSGIEWLGEIPAHWEVVRLGRKIVLQRGVDITKEEQNEGSVPVISSGGVSSFHDKPFARGPGVIVGRKGTAGAVYFVDQDYWPHDTTLWVKEFWGNYPRYVFYKLCTMDLASFDTGSANPTLNRNLVHPVVVSWPPVEEQAEIASFLDRETARINLLVGKIRQSMETLREYRAALISAAVTGKIKVNDE